jgi:predicted  nucleic acid-binding Zn-ribbon protein
VDLAARRGNRAARPTGRYGGRPRVDAGDRSLVARAGSRTQEDPLKAEPSAQQTLLDLQDSDSALARLQHRRTSLPEHARIEELTAQLAELRGRQVEVETRVSDLTRAQSKAEAEVEQVKSRRARDEERLSSGAITNPKDLENLQHEMGALERRISTLEDEELEVMEDLDIAQAELRAVTADHDAVATELEQVAAARDAAIATIDDEIVAVTQERESTAPAVPKDLLALYDKVRTQYGGLGAAALRARRCEGCRLELNGADLRELAARPVDDVLRCPECSRILVRTAESGL